MSELHAKGVLPSSLLILWIMMSGAAFAQEPLQVLVPGRVANVSYQSLGEDQLLVSVTDAEEKAVRGLVLEDFVVQKGAERAHLLSVEPLETNEQIGLNMILVLDNSASMKRRNAVESLLSAMEEILSILRPIDQVYVIVFDEDGADTLGEWTLHTNQVKSTDPTELREFLRDSFDAGLSIKTFLYEGILSGLEIARKMPEDTNKLFAVFSDGEDINSAPGRSVVEAQAQGIANLKVFAIDYMPAPTVDPFLQSFAQGHGGRVWKAASASQLLPIFQDFATTLRNQYVVSYRLPQPPRGTLEMEPSSLHLEILTLLDGSPVGGQIFFDRGASDIASRYALYSDKVHAQGFDEGQLLTPIERYHNVLNIIGTRLMESPELRIRIVGCNSGVGAEADPALSTRRAESVRRYLNEVWGVSEDRMQVEARGLPAQAAPPDVLGGPAENQRVEVLFQESDQQAQIWEALVSETELGDAIELKPKVTAEYGVAGWQLDVLADGVVIKTMEGRGEPNPSYTIGLADLGKGRLLETGHVQARLKVTDIYGDTLETSTDAVPVLVTENPAIDELLGPPNGSLAMLPETLTIEEVTTIDSSPLLNYVFFEAGKSEIPERYVLLGSQQEAEAFDDGMLKGAMEKYLHVLNILGKRLASLPEARITLVGCNSDEGPEKGRIDLSQGRAEAIRSYLRYIWGIDPSRMEVQARNLPEFPSSNRIEEGRLENQRVEFHSETAEILDPTLSTYVEERADAQEIGVVPKIAVGYGVKEWRLNLKGDGTAINTMAGTGDLAPVYTFSVEALGLKTLAAHENILAELELVDQAEQPFKVAAATSTTVRFAKREQRLSEHAGYRVVEKYALILFDYDSSKVKGRNKVIVDRIIGRLREVPEALVRIAGHTDTIGSEAYNLKLSERRAKAVFDQMAGAGMSIDERTSYLGVGPKEPLYDNGSPEGRAFNRTVTVSLEYETRD